MSKADIEKEIEELEEELEQLENNQIEVLGYGGDDLSIRYEIAEVEEELNEKKKLLNEYTILKPEDREITVNINNADFGSGESQTVNKIQKISKEEVDKFRKIESSIRMLYFHNYINDTQFFSMIDKLQNQINEKVKELQRK